MLFVQWRIVYGSLKNSVVVFWGYSIHLITEDDLSRYPFSRDAHCCNVNQGTIVNTVQRRVLSETNTVPSAEMWYFYEAATLLRGLKKNIPGWTCWTTHTYPTKTKINTNRDQKQVYVLKGNTYFLSSCSNDHIYIQLPSDPNELWQRLK